MAYTSYNNEKWLLERKNKNGYKERVVYTGNLKQKPKGWKLIGKA